MNHLAERSASTAAAVIGQLIFGSLCVLVFQAPRLAHAQSLRGLPNPIPPMPDNLTLPVWFPPVWSQALTSPEPTTIKTEQGETPPVIPQYQASRDATGDIASYQPEGPTVTAGNAFFTALATNGRTCFTCHQFQAGWAINPATAIASFSAPTGPIHSSRQ